MSSQDLITITVSKCQLDSWMRAEEFYLSGLDAWGLKALVARHYGYKDVDAVRSAVLFEKLWPSQPSQGEVAQ